VSKVSSQTPPPVGGGSSNVSKVLKVPCAPK